MIEVAICDDENYMVELIKNELHDIIDPLIEYNCHNTTNPKEIIKLTKKINIDLLMIDIEMPVMNGFEVARLVRKYNENILIIFITNLDMYVYESLKYRPFRFVRKSHMEDIKEALLSVVSQIILNKQQLDIQIGNVITSIKFQDIVYFESMHNDVRLLTVNSEYKYRATLKSIQRQLQGKGFIRIHSGFLINVKYINLVKNLEIEMNYGDNIITLPVSRSRRNDLILEYKKSLR